MPPWLPRLKAASTHPPHGPFNLRWGVERVAQIGWHRCHRRAGFAAAAAEAAAIAEEDCADVARRSATTGLRCCRLDRSLPRPSEVASTKPLKTFSPTANAGLDSPPLIAGNGPVAPIYKAHRAGLSSPCLGD